MFKQCLIEYVFGWIKILSLKYIFFWGATKQCDPNNISSHNFIRMNLLNCRKNWMCFISRPDTACLNMLMYAVIFFLVFWQRQRPALQQMERRCSDLLACTRQLRYEPAGVFLPQSSPLSSFLLEKWKQRYKGHNRDPQMPEQHNVITSHNRTSKPLSLKRVQETNYLF